MLNKADWWYEMSDGHSVWRRGNNEFGKLQQIKKLSPEHAVLYDTFEKAVVERTPRPEKPV